MNCTGGLIMNQKCTPLESFRNVQVVEDMSFKVYEGEGVGFLDQMVQVKQQECV